MPRRSRSWVLSLLARLQQASVTLVRKSAEIVRKLVPSPPPLLTRITTSLIRYSLSFISSIRSSISAANIEAWLEKGYLKSIKTLEAHKVTTLDLELQRDVIMEMVLNSTNPSVSKIALRSVSAFHAFPVDEVRDIFHRSPDFDDFVELLLKSYRDSFVLPVNRTWYMYDVLDAELADQLTRAMLLFPENMVGSDDWSRISAFERLSTQDLKYAGVLAYAITRWQWGFSLEAFVDFIDTFEATELSVLHVWLRAQFNTLASPTLQHHHEYRVQTEELTKLLLGRLTSIRNELTVQEQVIIGLLFASFAGAYEYEALDASCRDILESESSAEAVKTSMQLIIVLPNIVRHALDLEAELQRKLFVFLSGMMDYYLHMQTWQTTLTFASETPVYAHVLPVLRDVRGQLSSRLETLIEEDDTKIALLNILSILHAILTYYGFPAEGLSRTLYHQSAIIRLDKDQDFFMTLFHTSGTTEEEQNGQLVASLREYCDFIHSSRLVGLREPYLPFGHFLHLMDTPHMDFAFEQLERLFHSFFQIDSREIPLELVHTARFRDLTLLYMLWTVKRMHSQYPDQVVKTLANWRLMLDRALKQSGIVTNERRWKRQQNVYLTENIDIRDVSWMLDGYDCHSHLALADPYDLSDVKWIWEETERADLPKIKARLDDTISWCFDGHKQSKNLSALRNRVRQ